MVQRHRTLAELGQRAQHPVEVGQVEQHGRVEQVGLSQLEHLVARAQEHLDVVHAEELAGEKNRS